MALGIDAIGVAVVDDLVGLQDAALVVELDVADRRDGIVGGVVDEFVGAEEHAVVLPDRPAAGSLREPFGKLSARATQPPSLHRRRAWRQRNRATHAAGDRPAVAPYRRG